MYTNGIWCSNHVVSCTNFFYHIYSYLVLMKNFCPFFSILLTNTINPHICLCVCVHRTIIPIVSFGILREICWKYLLLSNIHEEVLNGVYIQGDSIRSICRAWNNINDDDYSPNAPQFKHTHTPTRYINTPPYIPTYSYHRYPRCKQEGNNAVVNQNELLARNHSGGIILLSSNTHKRYKICSWHRILMYRTIWDSVFRLTSKSQNLPNGVV